MSPLILFVQAGVLLFALWYARSAPGRGIIELYFDMQIVAVLAIYGSLLFVKWSDSAYAWVFVGANLPVYGTMTLIAHRSFLAHNFRWMALFCVLGISLGLAWRAFAGLGHVASWMDYIGLADGLILMSCGMMAGIAAPFMPRSRISLVLGMLWMTEACFRWGFVIHLPSPAWVDLNLWVPCFLVATATLYLGRLRRQDGSGLHIAARP